MGTILSPYASANVDEQAGLENGIENSIVEVSSETQAIINQYVSVENNRFVIDESGLKSALPDTEYSKAMEQLSYVNGQIQESADASSVVTTVDDETIRVYAVDEVIPKEEEEILTHPSLPPSKDGPQYTSSPYAYKGKNAIDFNFWDVQVWLSKTTVGAMIVGTTAAAVFILNKRFPSMSNTVAWAVATAVGGYLAEKAARAMYLKVSYFGGIKEVRFF